MVSHPGRKNKNSRGSFDSASRYKAARGSVFVAPLSIAAVVQVSRPAPIASGGLETASIAGLETGVTTLYARGQKCSSEHARRRSAAPSGVMSRCGMASISKPTMNLRPVAERSSGG